MPKVANPFPLTENMNMRMELIGLEATQNSGAGHTSSGRADMFASHLAQAMVLDGCDFPQIFTGMEYELGTFEFSKSNRDQDGEVLARIAKYPQMAGLYKLNDNPSWIVVYYGREDKQIHYFTIENYTQCSDGYGYKNKLSHFNLLQPGNEIEKELKFSTSPAHKGNQYCVGVNANVAYMTIEDTIEDAMAISRSLANKMLTTAIYKKSYRININQHPINKYGDENEFKFLPDIGEFVGEDGVLWAARRIGDSTFASDVAPHELERVQYLHDDIYYAPPGAKIIGLDFAVARSGSGLKHYQQIEKYQKGNEHHWREIVAVYMKYCDRYEISDEFQRLVTTAVERLIAAGIRVPKMPWRKNVNLLTKNGRPIEFIQFDVTYTIQRPVANGFKISDQEGCKGVICHIYEDEDMPVDEQGIRADIMIDPASPIKRMNPFQCYKQAINRTSEFVRRRLAEIVDTDPVLAIETLLDYYNDVNPLYANKVRETKPTHDAMLQHVKKTIADKIYMLIPPTLNTVKPELIVYLQDKWKVPVSRVTYTKRDYMGNKIGTFKTNKPVCIGSKYLLLLCKLPDPASAGVAHTSMYNTPMRPGAETKLKHQISATALRLGEDELRIRCRDIKDTGEDTRFIGIQSSSQFGVNKVIEALLESEHPTNINRINVSNDVLMSTNSPVALYHHMMQTMGVESRYTETDMPLPDFGNLSDYEDDEIHERQTEVIIRGGLETDDLLDTEFDDPLREDPDL